MECSNCGQILREDAKFCTSCAHAVERPRFKGTLGGHKSPDRTPPPGAAPVAPVPTAPPADVPTPPPPAAAAADRGWPAHPTAALPLTELVVPDPTQSEGEEDEEEVPAGEETAAATRRSRRWVLPVAAVTLTLLTFVIGGALLGYRFATERNGQSQPAANIAVRGAPDARDAGAAEPPVQMPDVLRLTRDDAVEALSDIGFDSRKLTIEERAYVGPAGRVVSQRPARGTTNPAEVVLEISTPARVPSILGLSAAQAKTKLEAIGAVVAVREVYQADKAPGSVLAVTPAVGEVATSTMTLDIGAEPYSVFLTGIDPIAGGCTGGQASVGTQTSAYALTCRAARVSATGAPTPAVAYDVAGRVDRLKATVGITNRDEPGTRARVRVLVDGNERFNQEIVWGTAAVIDIPITGASRVDLLVTEPGADDDGWNGADVTFLEPTFLGSKDAIDELSS